METTGRAVGEWLASSGRSASAVARRAGVSPSTMSRILRGQVDPSVGTVREIALACGVDLDLTARRASDPHAAAGARAMLEEGYEPPAVQEVIEWTERLPRLAEEDGPVGIVEAAAAASSPLERPDAVLLAGSVTLGRVASAGDASNAAWALSGAPGLYFPDQSEVAPSVTILWSGDVRAALHLLADTDLRQTHRRDKAVLAVVPAEPELFSGSFSKGLIRYAAPIQIILDCISQGGAVAREAVEEAMSW